MWCSSVTRSRLWMMDPVVCSCTWHAHARPVDPLNGSTIPSLPVRDNTAALLCRFAALEGRMVIINSSPTNRAWVQECYGQVGGVELRGVIAASRQ